MASPLLACLVFAALFAPCGARAAGVLLANEGAGACLEPREQLVAVVVNNTVAVTEVIQLFKNTEPRQVDALFSFPVPEGASVSGLGMWIDGKEMVGEVSGRTAEASPAGGRTGSGPPERKGYKPFEMRVFPVAPLAVQRVRLVYSQELEVDHGWARYVYPLATTMRPDGGARPGGLELRLMLKSETPIKDMLCPSHPGCVSAAGQGGMLFANMRVEDAGLGRDVELRFRVGRPATGADVVYSRQPGEDGFFMMNLYAGDEPRRQGGGRDYVFVADNSASMADGGKLDLVGQTVGALLKLLGPGDRFEIVACNIGAESLFGGLKAADDVNRGAALEFLATRRAAGGTDLRPALRSAYELRAPGRQLNVVLLTDGMAETGRGAGQGLLGVTQERPENCKEFCVGVGKEINRDLLTKIAVGAGGLAAFVSGPEGFAPQARDFLGQLCPPALRNLRVEFPAGVGDVEPKELGDLFHGLPLRVYGRYSGTGAAKAVLVGTDVDGKELKLDMPLAFPAEDQSNPEIARMWAWRRLKRLEPDPKAAVEVARLGEGYSIASARGSYLVLANDAAFKAWKRKQSKAAREGFAQKTWAELQDELNALKAAGVSVGPMPAAKQLINAVISCVYSEPEPPSASPRRGSARAGVLSGSLGGGVFGPDSGTLLLLFGWSGLGLGVLLVGRARRPRTCGAARLLMANLNGGK